MDFHVIINDILQKIYRLKIIKLSRADKKSTGTQIFRMIVLLSLGKWGRIYEKEVIGFGNFSSQNAETNHRVRMQRESVPFPTAFP